MNEASFPNNTEPEVTRELLQAKCFFGLVVRGKFQDYLRLVDSLKKNGLTIIYRKASPIPLAIVEGK